jgi:spermidine/putrescine transport system permease protein
MYLLVFFAAPSLIMVLASFRSPGEFGGLAPLTDEAGKLDLNVDSYVRFVTEPVFMRVFAKSAGYATVTTLFGLLLAYPLATLIASSGRKYRDLLLLLVILPFWSNFLIRVYAWMIILGPNAALARVVNSALSMFGLGPVPLLFSGFAVLTCLVYVHLPFMVLPLYATLEKIDNSLLEAAADLGARPWTVFRQVTIPLARPGIAAGSLLCFIPIVGEFVVPDLLGGSRSLMIGQTLWLEFFSNRDWPVAAAVATTLLVLLLAPILAYQHQQMRALEQAR